MPAREVCLAHRGRAVGRLVGSGGESTLETAGSRGSGVETSGSRGPESGGRQSEGRHGGGDRNGSTTRPRLQPQQSGALGLLLY